MSLPLPTLLSQTVVAFTIEADNEFERLMPHRTTSHGSTADGRHGTWLVSLAMWFNCLRYVGETPILVRELENLAGMPTNVDGMRRWGYVTVESAPDDHRAKPPQGDLLMRVTRAGRKAQQLWAPLPGLVEQRWRERFGAAEIDRLRESAAAIVGRLDDDLPDYLPIIFHGLFTKVSRRPRNSGDVTALPLIVLLAKALLEFGLEYDGQSDVALAIGANVLRVLDAEGVPTRELPRRAGVSKQAISMALGVLGKRDLAAEEPREPGSRTKIVRLTAEGLRAKDEYRQRLAAIEERWRARFGADVDALRAALTPMADAPLVAPNPTGWRAAVRQPNTLPHYPMVLHRGGYPDGA
jgi:DNA-binding MarR family transcriptional regulator